MLNLGRVPTGSFLKPGGLCSPLTGAGLLAPMRMTGHRVVMTQRDTALCTRRRWKWMRTCLTLIVNKAVWAVTFFPTGILDRTEQP